MNEPVQFIAQHGYWLLFSAVLGRQAYLPILANLFLVAAWALARSGKFNLSATLGLSRKFTSASVALALQRKGVQHIRPLAGGLRAWRDRGFPVTSEVGTPPIPVARGCAPSWF
jgi:hypothetical protein